MISDISDLLIASMYKILSIVYFISITSFNPLTNPLRYGHRLYSKYLVIGKMSAIRTDTGHCAILAYSRVQDIGIIIYRHFID